LDGPAKPYSQTTRNSPPEAPRECQLQNSRAEDQQHGTFLTKRPSVPLGPRGGPKPRRVRGAPEEEASSDTSSSNNREKKKGRKKREEIDAARSCDSEAAERGDERSCVLSWVARVVSGGRGGGANEMLEYESIQERKKGLLLWPGADRRGEGIRRCFSRWYSNDRESRGGGPAGEEAG